MLKYRILSGCLIGGAFVLVVNFLPAVGAWLLLLIVAALAQVEFYGIVNLGGKPAFKVLGVVCGGLLISATFITIGPDIEHMARAYRWEQAVMLGSLVAVFIRQMPQRSNPQPLATIGCTLLGILYVPFLLNFITRLAFAWEGGGFATEVSRAGRLLVLYLVLVVKSSDMGAYFTGKLVGRHKLFPRLSPGKTWEGVAGGIAAALAVSLAFCWTVGGDMGRMTLTTGHAVVLGVLLAVAGLIGDLCESLLKRAAGTKDSSSAIPGLGGILDVLDSLLFGAPALYVYAWLFLL
ncbi:MAG: CDP-archaeol synthase [Lentisphaerae bacterium]|nr:CDP-archaeol synthase [Lentisphaerota bacterium]